MLFPNEFYDSINDIPFEDLYKQGFRGLIFDIDNTLVEHNAPANEKTVDFFNQLRNIGFKTTLISNNESSRVEPFAKTVGSLYVSKAWKPRKEGYLKACSIMGLKCSECAFVGDQIFTDIWGANNAHIHSILVKQIGPDPEIQIVLKRVLEKPVIGLYNVLYKR